MQRVCISAIREIANMAGSETTQNKVQDEAAAKGAVEDDGRQQNSGGPTSGASLGGQMGHRDQDDLLKDSDTDFPEPDAKEEHSGEAP
jgi:hypothetical protein